jgi:hypothetical protein
MAVSNNLSVNEPTGQEPEINKRLLNPVDRISEVIFGLIMVLTFTCTYQCGTSGQSGDKRNVIRRNRLQYCLGTGGCGNVYCNSTYRKRTGRSILRYIRKTNNENKARDFIADALPPVIASVLQSDTLENIRKSLLTIPESNLKIKLTWTDFKIAFAIFLLVFLSTLPVALPFAFIDNDTASFTYIKSHSHCINVRLRMAVGEIWQL